MGHRANLQIWLEDIFLQTQRGRGGLALVDVHNDHLRPAAPLSWLFAGILTSTQNQTFFWGTVIQLHPIWKTGLWRGRRVKKRQQDLPTRLKRQGADAEFLLPGNQHDLWNMTFTNITLVQSQSTSQGVLCSSCKVSQLEASPFTDEMIVIALLHRTQTNREKSKTA